MTDDPYQAPGGYIPPSQPVGVTAGESFRPLPAYDERLIDTRTLHLIPDPHACLGWTAGGDDGWIGLSDDEVAMIRRLLANRSDR